MHEFEIKPELYKTLIKLLKKDKNSYEAVMNKIEEIINSPDIKHYKNLKYNMKDSKRVHVKHFVLIFNYNKSKNFISFEDYDHHDNIYAR